MGRESGPLMGEASPVIGKSESEAGTRWQAARSRAARVAGEAGGTEGGAEPEGMRWGAGQAPGCGGGSGGKRLWRKEVRGEAWKRMSSAGVEVLMSAEGGACRFTNLAPKTMTNKGVSLFAPLNHDYRMRKAKAFHALSVIPFSICPYF